jgi:hypothetical protein
MVTARSKLGLGALALLLVTTTAAAALAAPPEDAAGGDAPGETSAEGAEPANGEGEPDGVPTKSAASPVAPPTEEKPSASNAASPRALTSVHHAPISSAIEKRDLVVLVELDDPHLVKSVVLVFRSEGQALEQAELRRGDGGYEATIPASKVVGSIAYAIEVERTDGSRIAVFASRAALHSVQLLPEATDEREARLLARLGGRRSVVSASSEYADFDASTAGRDYFWKVEGRYVYRPLRTVAEFGIRGGVIRGEAGSASQVGLNYGAPSVRFRMHDHWHLELEGMASISDEGFSTGGGAALMIGDPYASKLVLGTSFVGISDESYFGSRFYSRVDLAAHQRVTVSPIIEITDMPNATLWGVRLLAELAVDLGAGFGASLHGGYQARASASGGPSVGGSLALGF